MAHQTGIHGEGGGRVGRGPRVSARGGAHSSALGPGLVPGTILGKLPVPFCRRGSLGVGTSGGVQTYCAQLGVGVRVCTQLGRKCLCTYRGGCARVCPST